MYCSAFNSTIVTKATALMLNTFYYLIVLYYKILYQENSANYCSNIIQYNFFPNANEKMNRCNCNSIYCINNI